MAFSIPLEVVITIGSDIKNLQFCRSGFVKVFIFCGLIKIASSNQRNPPVDLPWG